MGITSKQCSSPVQKCIKIYDIPWNFHELMLCSDSLQHSQQPIAAIALFRTVQDVWPQFLKRWSPNKLRPTLTKLRQTSDHTLLGTNISPPKGSLKMIFLFPRWDMLVCWRVVGFFHLNANQRYVSKTAGVVLCIVV